MNATEGAAAVARQRVKRDALERAELDIARACDGCTVECSEDGREKRADLYDGAEGVMVASFRARSWARVAAAARGWAGVSE